MQEHSNRRKEKGKISSRASPTGKTKSARKSELKTMKSTMNGGEQDLHGLAPKLNGLAPKWPNSASVRRRKTNNPSLESLSSCRHEELAIDGVRAPRATKAVLEPGAIIYTLKLPTVTPYSSMRAWIGVEFDNFIFQLFFVPYSHQVSHGFLAPWQPIS